MLNREYARYVVLNEKEHPVAIDASSGGYPWDPYPSLRGVHYWHTIEEAERYAHRFPGYSIGCMEFKITKVNKLDKE